MTDVYTRHETDAKFESVQNILDTHRSNYVGLEKRVKKLEEASACVPPARPCFGKHGHPIVGVLCKNCLMELACADAAPAPADESDDVKWAADEMELAKYDKDLIRLARMREARDRFRAQEERHRREIDAAITRNDRLNATLCKEMRQAEAERDKAQAALLDEQKRWEKFCDDRFDTTKERVRLKSELAEAQQEIERVNLKLKDYTRILGLDGCLGDLHERDYVPCSAFNCGFYAKCKRLTDAQKEIEKLKAERPKCPTWLQCGAGALCMAGKGNITAIPTIEYDRLKALDVPATDEEREEYAKWCENHAKETSEIFQRGKHNEVILRIARLLRSQKKPRITWKKTGAILHVKLNDSVIESYGIIQWQEAVADILYHMSKHGIIDLVEEQAEKGKA